MLSPDPSRDDLAHLVGTLVAGKYRVDRELGRGGMGAVFSATNATIGKRVALKFLTRGAALDRDATLRFQREAEAASVVESEHIVHVFDSGISDDGLPFLVMELLNGEDLRTRLQREGTLPVAAAIDITTQVLRALVRAHGAGIVHRDLKPDNVFLCRRDDGTVHVKIVDFGISKLAGGRSAKTLTRRGTVLGTAYYMAPEQAQAAEAVDHRADLYGVGTLLFEMLAGRPPHMAPTHEAVLVAICTKDAPDVRSARPDVPHALARLVTSALARDRDMRIQSADQFLSALGKSSSTEATEPHAAAATSAAGEAALPGGTAARRRSSSRRTLVAGVVATLLGFALTALLITARKRSEPASESPRTLSEIASRPSASHAEPTPPPGVSADRTAAAAIPAPPPTPTTPSSVRTLERPRPAKAAPRDAGVARSLTLSTREP